MPSLSRLPGGLDFAIQTAPPAGKSTSAGATRRPLEAVDEPVVESDRLLVRGHAEVVPQAADEFLE